MDLFKNVLFIGEFNQAISGISLLSSSKEISFAQISKQYMGVKTGKLWEVWESGTTSQTSYRIPDVAHRGVFP